MSEVSEEEAEENPNADQVEEHEEILPKTADLDPPPATSFMEVVTSVLIHRNARIHTFVCCMGLLALVLALPCRALYDSHDVVSLISERYSQTRDHEATLIDMVNHLSTAQEASVWYSVSGQPEFKAVLDASLSALRGMKASIVLNLKSHLSSLNIFEELLTNLESIAAVRGRYSVDSIQGPGILQPAVETTADAIVNAIDDFRILIRQYPTCRDLRLTAFDKRCKALNLTAMINQIHALFSKTRIMFYNKEFVASGYQQFSDVSLHLTAVTAKFNAVATDLADNGPEEVYGEDVNVNMFTELQFDFPNTKAVANRLTELVHLVSDQTNNDFVREYLRGRTVAPFSELMALYSTTEVISANLMTEIETFMAQEDKAALLAARRDTALASITTTVAVCATLMVVVFAYLLVGVGVRQRLSLLTGGEFLTFAVIGLVLLLIAIIFVTFIARDLVEQSTQAGDVLSACQALSNVTLRWYKDAVSDVWAVARGALPAVDATKDTTALLTSLAITPMEAMATVATLNFSKQLRALIVTQGRYNTFRDSLAALQTQYNATNATIQLMDLMLDNVGKVGPRLVQRVMSEGCDQFLKDDLMFSDTDAKAEKLCSQVFVMAHAALASVLGPESSNAYWDISLMGAQTQVMLQMGVLRAAATTPLTAFVLAATQEWMERAVVPLRALLLRNKQLASVSRRVRDQTQFILGVQEFRKGVVQGLPRVVRESQDAEMLRMFKRRRLIVWLTVFTVWVVQLLGYFVWRCMFPLVW